MNVYVAAPYADAERVRRVHKLLIAIGCAFTSRWAEQASGPEDFASLTPEELANTASCNDTDVLRAGVALVLARPGLGGEMFAEARLAYDSGRRVLWVGRKTLSAWRPGVERFESFEDALSRLLELRVQEDAA